VRMHVRLGRLREIVGISANQRADSRVFHLSSARSPGRADARDSKQQRVGGGFRRWNLVLFACAFAKFVFVIPDDSVRSKRGE